MPTGLLPLPTVLPSTPAFEGLAWARALGLGFPLCQGPLPQTSCSPSILLPGDHAIPGESLARLCAVPGLSQGLAGCPGPSPGTQYFPSTGRLTHSDSSASGHTTGLGPPAANDHLVSRAQPRLCALIINVGQRRKERNNKGWEVERKDRGNVCLWS